MATRASTLPIRAQKLSTGETTPRLRGGYGYKLFDTTDQSWRNEAACRGCDPDWWFPMSAQSGRQRKHTPGRAERICADCPVQAECLAEARRSHSRDGIWGGVLVK